MLSLLSYCDLASITWFTRPCLTPEIEKCEEHSHPDLRECATKAKASLLKGLEAGTYTRSHFRST